MELLATMAGLTETTVYTIALVFMRVGAAASLLPGFGEQSLPQRVRLLLAIGLTIISWPLIAPQLPPSPDTLAEILTMFLIEALIGVMLGLSLRMMVMVLQLAGSIAAQATSLSQIMGAGATPDPLPAIGNILVISGLALALVGGLHIKAITAISLSYSVLPMSSVPSAPDFTGWGVSQIAHAFSLAFTLSAPFVVASFAYNLTLGVINRAMPQLMVAFIGAPAITAAGILILFLTAPVLLLAWNERLDNVLADPFGPR